MVIFAGWGIATGLTFWSAMIKATAMIAQPNEQGRFFGFLDGGRGLVEAALATIAVALFAYLINRHDATTDYALVRVIYFYVAFVFAMAPLALWLVDIPTDDAGNRAFVAKDTRFVDDLAFVLRNQELWLAATILLCGYQLFWATYSFSAFMQQNFGLTAVAVGSITVAKLWMRPIGAATAGIAGDLLNREYVIVALMLAGSASLASLAFLPSSAGVPVLLTIVLLVGVVTYAIRGIYWATLDSARIPTRIKGLAIGVMSLIGYAPDIYLPLVSGVLVDRYPGRTGYSIYFLGIAASGVIGALAALQLKRRIALR